MRASTSRRSSVLASSRLAWTGAAANLRLVGHSLGGSLAVHFALACPHPVASLVLLAPGGLIRLSPSAAALRLLISRIIPEFLRVGITARILRRQPSPLPSSTAEAAPLGHPPRPCLLERVTAFTAWMASHHPGFVPAVISCFRSAPLMHQHDSWRRLAADDNIIDSNNLTRQGLPLLGGSYRVVWKILPGTHEFIITHADPILKELDHLWGMN